MITEITHDIVPCPFCGGQKLVLQAGTKDSVGWPINMMCENCGACGPWVYSRALRGSVEELNLALREWCGRVGNDL